MKPLDRQRRRKRPINSWDLGQHCANGYHSYLLRVFPLYTDFWKKEFNISSAPEVLRYREIQILVTEKAKELFYERLRG